VIFVIILASALVGWSLGRNNVATLFGPSVVSGIMNYRVATVMAGIFVFVGSIIHGSAGLSTVNSITKVSLGISLSASIGTAILIILMTHFSIPTSITQGIVGSLVGLGMMNGYVNWHIVLKVAIFWVIAPFGAIAISFVSHNFWGNRNIFCLSQTTFHAFQQNQIFKKKANDFADDDSAFWHICLLFSWRK